MLELRSQRQRSHPASGDPPRLLVVDDDAELLVLVRRAARLASRELLVDCAPTAHEARALLAETPYDVVLLDYYLDGDETGADLVRVARRHQRDAVLAMMSAVGVDGLLERTRRDRRLRLLPKPFSAAVLHHFLHDALGLAGRSVAHVPSLG